MRVLVAGLVDAPPTPPGVDRVPGPGEAVVSPALAALMKTVPADQLGDRIGTVVGTIGDVGLRSPDELVAVVGLTPATLETLGASPITAFDPTPKAPDIPPIAVTDDRAGGHRRARPGRGLRLDRDPAVGRSARAAAGGAAAGRRHGLAGDAAGRGRGPVRERHRGRRWDRPVLPDPPARREDPARRGDLVPGVDRAAARAGDRAVAPRSRSSEWPLRSSRLRRVVVTPLGVQRRQTPGMPSARRAVPLVGFARRCCRSSIFVAAEPGDRELRPRS